MLEVILSNLHYHSTRKSHSVCILGIFSLCSVISLDMSSRNIVSMLHCSNHELPSALIRPALLLGDFQALQ
jgi:hypothetical protein